MSAAAMLALAALTPVSVSAGAVGGTSLNQTPPIDSTDQGFQGSAEECAELDLAPGEVFWHFVLTSTDAASATLEASFENAGDVSTVSYKKSGGTLHFGITTPTADSLLGAWTAAVGNNLNLSHICQGEPGTTPTPEVTPTPTPEVTPTPTPEVTPTPTPEVTPTPTPEVTPTPTPEVTPTPTPEVTPTPTGSELPAESERPTPTGGVEGASGTPGVTPPATDTIADASAPTSGSWRIVLVGLATLIVMALLFTKPAQARNTR